MPDRAPNDPPPPREQTHIHIRGARTHNLQNVSLDIPRNRLVLITGLSGSGKSSLAFDTLYAEGQRKYVESLSAYARQFLGQSAKPDCDQITGLPPTIAIAQHAARANPRSTVATTTEVYDLLRLLFARAGTPHCPKCDRPVTCQTIPQIVDHVLALPDNTRAMILAPLVRDRPGDHARLLERITREGYVRARIDGETVEIKTAGKLDPDRPHTIDAVVDRIVIKPDIRTRIHESVETALRLAGGRVTIAHQPPDDRTTWHDDPRSTRYACLHCDRVLPDLQPRLFSFNSPHGACPACTGLGIVHTFDPDLVVPDPRRPLENGAIEPWCNAAGRLTKNYDRLLSEFCTRFNVSPSAPLNALPKRVRTILLHGTKPADAYRFGHAFEGAIPNLRRRWETTDSQSVRTRLMHYMADAPCDACNGARLRPEALAVRVADHTIHDLVRMSILTALDTLERLRFDGERAKIAAPILREMTDRLRFMRDVGIGYLTLDRAANSLSGGEAQRIRLATQIGSGLVGVGYVLDEPTIGLHPRDNARLIRSLRNLTDLGNSVLVVEHDIDMIQAADWIIDVGPRAGAHGGRILVNGTHADLLASAESITAQYLRGERRITPRSKRRKPTKKQLVIQGAAENNLQEIDATIPLGLFCCITGVSGSGKSTLVNQTLLPALRRPLHGARRRPGAHTALKGTEHIDKVIEIDQSPIGRSSRSNAATYTGIFDLVRQVFARTREAKVRGYDASRFSFNVKGGRCEACQGQGLKRIEMHFLPDVFVTCDACAGTRYQRETLDVRYRGKSIADVLDLRVEEALAFFENLANIHQLLAALHDVGLGYLSLGQPADTLSGGEAQRVKLAAELGKSPAGHTLYVLDEPTTGLHFADIEQLLHVLNRLCDAGHSLLVIEHNLDVIRQADWIIDLGPGGGADGGQIVATGPPDQIANEKQSHTARYLAQKK